METIKFISGEEEKQAIDELVTLIKKDQWIDNETFIVACAPDYSSIVCQLLNHRLSYSNRNELLDQLTLQMPYPNMSQVYNADEGKYEQYDKYVSSWVSKYINPSYKYLFIDSAVIRGKNFSTLKRVLAAKHPNLFYRCACLFLHNDSIFTPDYYVCPFTEDTVMFSWENPQNPNWK